MIDSVERDHRDLKSKFSEVQRSIASVLFSLAATLGIYATVFTKKEFDKFKCDCLLDFNYLTK